MSLSEWKDVASIIGTMVTALSFAFAAFQYYRSSLWKTKEFVAREVKDFLAGPKVELALRLLDWTDWEIEVPSNDGSGPRKVLVDEAMLASALRASEDPVGFEAEEIMIRDAFDALFEGYAHFNSFIEVGLVEPADLVPYLKYWLELLSGRRNHKSKEVLKALEAYASDYHGGTPNRFMARLGYHINER